LVVQHTHSSGNVCCLQLSRAGSNHWLTYRSTHRSLWHADIQICSFSTSYATVRGIAP
jgi:hypothetical protein